MVDLAISGRVVITSEIHRLAVEKYGIASGWRNMYLLYDIAKTAWMSDAIVKSATDIFNECIFNANEFNTPLNLYDVIHTKYKKIFQVSYHIKSKKKKRKIINIFLSKFQEEISSFIYFINIL